MSIWCSVSGTINIKKECHFSVKKYTRDMFDEISISISPDGGKFNMSFSLDGVEAAKFMEIWIKGIPGTVDCVAEITFIK